MPVENLVNQLLAQFGCYADYTSSPGLPPDGHEHDGFELGVLHAGSAEFATEYWSHTLFPSSGILFDGRSTHYAHAVRKRYVRTCVTFLPELIRDAELREYLEEIAERRDPHLFSVTPDTTRRFFWAVNELSAMSKRGCSQKLRAHLLEMLLLNLYEDRKNEPSCPRAVWAAIEYMRENVSDRTSISHLAKQLFYSESQLRYLFKSSTGYSPQEYWNKLKIEHACTLLENDATPVHEVAAAVGFESLSGFQRAFKRNVGLSPTQYREARLLPPGARR